MKTIVFAGEKGGTGKSTLCALLIEYLTHLGFRINLLDRDPLLTVTDYLQNCQELNRQLLTPHPDYLLVDTAGSLGSSILQLKTANLIIVPFRAHYPDCRAILRWFNQLSPSLQLKTRFLPNCWQNTKEQREGIQQLKAALGEITEQNLLLPPLSNRPALYGPLLNGSATNFFLNHHPLDLLSIFNQIIPYEKPQK